jgi:hypothetical protein
VIKALLKQTGDFKNILAEKIEMVEKKVVNEGQEFKKVLSIKEKLNYS